MHGEPLPFWKTKSLDDMTKSEWESLCDGCARCCLVKLEDDDDARVYLTRLTCSMLHVRSCRCSDYPNRFEKMADCIEITPEKVRSLAWLPATCGYRIVHEGRDLAWWHPLISGSPDTVHDAGISVRSFAMNEKRVKLENYQRYVIDDFVD